MKKLITMAVAAIIGFGVVAAERPTCYTNKQGKVIIYLTNAVEVAKHVATYEAVRSGYSTDPNLVYPDDLPYVDAIYAESTNIVYCPFPESYPNGTRHYIAQIRATGGSLGMMNYAENNWFGDKSYSKNAEKIVAALDMVNWNFYGTPWATCNHFSRLNNFKKNIVTAANKTTKAKIRSEGKSFVVKDGVNPVQERLDTLTKALDAPYFQGLEAACANCGITVSGDFRKDFPTAEQVAELKRQVFVGEKDFTDENKVFLMVALGVEEYNKFVKEYNGDEQ